MAKESSKWSVHRKPTRGSGWNRLLYDKPEWKMDFEEEPYAYYYQIQLQLEVCKLSYCDFVVDWERLCCGKDCRWQTILYQCDRYCAVVYEILPEIVGKMWYKWKPVAYSESVVPIPTCTDLTDEQQDTDESEDMSKLWCYCNEPNFNWWNDTVWQWSVLLNTLHPIHGVKLLHCLEGQEQLCTGNCALPMSSTPVCNMLHMLSDVILLHGG